MRSLALVSALFAAVLALLAPAVAEASSSISYGVQDDAWLAFGPGTLESRLTTLDELGVDVVRFNLRWDQIAREKPLDVRDPADPAYVWGAADAVLEGLRAHRIAAAVTLLGTPGWANGGRLYNWAPTSGATFAGFAYAAQKRFPWVHKWLIWNEPNHREWLRPTTPAVYTRTLLNPAYAALHAASRSARVGAGVTAPRGNAGGVSPVAWIRGMRAAHARLDAYAHNPYPLKPRIESPFIGTCEYCTTITMGSLARLQLEVRRAWGAGKRIWLTEYGYQTNPPDRILGVSPARAAALVGEAAYRAYRAAGVDMLIHFMVRDDVSPGGWQSGFYTRFGAPKPALAAFRAPLAETARRGTRTTVWGQIRPRSGRQPYRLQQRVGGSWRWVGGTQLTNAKGFFRRTVTAPKGATLRVWSGRDRASGQSIRVT